ncbi:hypothetical protein [Couchioplanes caeruleus]|uniref:Uncharacterized protein n=1 Tax=Couchioplanes caeruleus TaxID=56438 RepID=A0A3N1GG86_9ACTN|nr:hypothetical protein [Couchioplanes caeruleus]ROP29244.1 hypothetical protein EDD30_2030 [Couchioplanes caeruleus]
MGETVAVAAGVFAGTDVAGLAGTVDQLPFALVQARPGGSDLGELVQDRRVSTIC